MIDISDLIIDRKSADVERAKKARAKLAHGEELLSTEKLDLERGLYTINTLNRVEGKIRELDENLRSQGYYAGISSTKEWTASDIFTQADHSRILDNIKKIKNALVFYRTMSTVPTYMFGWREANNIEIILRDTAVKYEDMVSRIRECGTFYCGEANDN